ncbi:MAG: preprotein translocase subunit SecE [Solirubrobacteraceae bacterium MAG38_C4-C5]|nr:preprotein translocase subunit SecE [Candidatus Siliceabacter maunaloa]
MARDRERARDRKARRKGLERENTPGPVDHGSGEVDEFQAELVSNAQGAGARDELPPREEADLEREAVAAGGSGGSGSGEPPTDRRDRDEGGGGIGRFPGFIKACWAELQRVQWPDRRQVGQATMVVLGFVALAGAFLGLMDLGASRLVDLIIL